MNTKLATTQIRLTEWAAVIKDCKTSGLKVDDYCRQHNLSRDSYYYWLRKIKETALKQAGFVELPTPESGPLHSVGAAPASFDTQMTIKTGTLELGINSNTSSELIHRVLEVVSHVK